MSNPLASKANSLGLSIGATNLVGMRDGQCAIIRPSTLTLLPYSPPELGNPTRTDGLRLTGFVDRVGDPVPLVASDGSTHRSETLAAEALDALTRAVANGAPASQMAVTVPAHWPAAVIDVLRGALRSKPQLCHDGTAPPLVSEATAALTALRSNPGLPSRGVIALCDFGGSGTGITLVDAASHFTPIGKTVRFPDFS